MDDDMIIVEVSFCTWQVLLAVSEVADFIWFCCFLFSNIYPQCLTSSVASLLRAPDSFEMYVHMLKRHSSK